MKMTDAKMIFIFLIVSFVESRNPIHLLNNFQMDDLERQIYHCGLTVADVHVSKQDPLDMQLCSLWQIKALEEKDVLFDQFDRSVKVTKLKLEDMFDLMERCNLLPANHRISLDKKSLKTAIGG
eukprot:TRINITY_DN6265_c0_g1_i6.p1 TRINITY_DN6265_c0_g1~~TRINITY_DN6265_c0_g1_i6.p1  ORF type:complete len:124 (+),score=15.53 TRINITY_DN6265_c0_g1_i6:59-430(+)